MTHYDIIITNGVILPAAGAPHTVNGHIGIKNGLIKHIALQNEKPPPFSATTTIDAKGSLICPGLINGHCHSAMTLFRGLADDLPLMTWLNDHIFPAEARFVTAEMVYWCSKLAAAEMILAGTTTVADGYFFESEAVKAFNDSGIRSVAAQGIIDFPAPGVPDPSGNLAAAKMFLANFPHNTLSNKALFCHSPYTCSSKTLQKAKQLADANNCLMFIHAAETQAECLQIKELYGASPIRYLNSLGVLDENSVCVHCVVVDDYEINLLKQSGCGVVTCPESNMKLASGVAPVPDLLRAGVPVSLGTDGCASNNNLDLFLEMNSLAKLHKVSRCDPAVLRATEALAAATSVGATVLGLPGTGTLQPGRQADIIIIDLHQPHLTPFYNQDALVYCAKGSDVTTSIIDGKLIMHNRKILTFDVDEAITRVNNLSVAAAQLSKSPHNF
jgi:5-methylthioadenosine/S-adenosylhomocysteine deaminase